MKILAKAVAIAVLWVCKAVAILDNKIDGAYCIMVERHSLALSKG